MGGGGDAVGGDGNGAAHLERLLARHRRGGGRGKGCRGGVSADGDGNRTPGPCIWRGHSHSLVDVRLGGDTVDGGGWECVGELVLKVKGCRVREAILTVKVCTGNTDHCQQLMIGK